MIYKQFSQEEIKEFNSVVKLSILIATTKDRRIMFNNLYQEFNKQVETSGFLGKGLEIRSRLIPRLNGDGSPVLDEETQTPIVDEFKESFKHPNIVEVIFEEDEREMPIGIKRKILLEKSKGVYIVYFDSDDFPEPEYIKEIMNALDSEPDCIGFKIAMTTNGTNPETCIHSLKNKEWTHDGKNYLRGVTIFNPVKKELALKCSFGNLRYGEDKMYSDMITPLCVNEFFIDKYMFNYRYNTSMPHNLKYGLDKDL